jgi:hypothetical protein
MAVVIDKATFPEVAVVDRPDDSSYRPAPRQWSAAYRAHLVACQHFDALCSDVADIDGAGAGLAVNRAQILSMSMSMPRFKGMVLTAACCVSSDRSFYKVKYLYHLWNDTGFCGLKLPHAPTTNVALRPVKRRVLLRSLLVSKLLSPAVRPVQCAGFQRACRFWAASSARARSGTRLR